MLRCIGQKSIRHRALGTFKTARTQGFMTARQNRATAPPDNTHTMDNGKVIDPTTDKNFDHWVAESDPPPDVGTISFNNSKLGFYSYDPPKGFTAGEIMQFRGARDCLTLDEVDELIKERNEKGTLELRGEDIVKP